MLQDQLALASILTVVDSMSRPLPPEQPPTPLRLRHPLQIQDVSHVTSFTYMHSPPVSVVAHQAAASPLAPYSRTVHQLPSPASGPSAMPVFPLLQTAPVSPTASPWLPVPRLIPAAAPGPSTTSSSPVVGPSVPGTHAPSTSTASFAHGLFSPPAPAMWNEHSFFYLCLTDMAQLSVGFLHAIRFAVVIADATCSFREFFCPHPKFFLPKSPPGL
jgi:hypothetical protein